jgi:hypothetical protein
MTKEDMVQVLRSVGVNENTITAMENAFDMGAAYEREQCATICETLWDYPDNGMATEEKAYGVECGAMIRNRSQS